MDNNFNSAVFWNNLISSIIDFALSAGLRLLGAAVVFVFGLKLVKTVTKSMRKTKKFKNIDIAAEIFISNFISIALKVIVILTAISILGVPMSNIIALLGSIGLAVGLALQGSFSNMAGGIVLLISRPFGIGDYIDINEKITGTVIEIGTLYTVINTYDNIRIVIPNGEISNAVLTNYSSNDKRLLEIVFGVPPESDFSDIKIILTNMLNSHSDILKEPPPSVIIAGYETSEIKIKARGWVSTDVYWKTRFDLNEQTKRLLAQEGIKISVPELNVNIKS